MASVTTLRWPQQYSTGILGGLAVLLMSLNNTWRYRTQSRFQSSLSHIIHCTIAFTRKSRNCDA